MIITVDGDGKGDIAVECPIRRSTISDQASRHILNAPVHVSRALSYLRSMHLTRCLRNR